MVEWRGPDFDPYAVDEAVIQKRLDRLAPGPNNHSAHRPPESCLSLSASTTQLERIFRDLDQGRPPRCVLARG